MFRYILSITSILPSYETSWGHSQALKKYYMINFTNLSATGKIFDLKLSLDKALSQEKSPEGVENDTPHL